MNDHVSTRIKADLTLLFVAIVWGSGFIVQRLVANKIGVFIFNGIRFLIGAICLLVIIGFRLKIIKDQIRWVLLGGVLLFAGSALQQAGIRTTTAGNAGFITGTYVVLIPILLAIFWHEKLHPISILAALLACTGLGLLSFTGKMTINPGDILEFLGAILWALHVIIVSISVQKMGFLEFSIGQYIVVAVLDMAFGLVFELKTFVNIPSALPLILYAGIFSIAMGFTLQALAQKNTPPSDASLILSLEAVFAAIFGYVLLQERLVPIQWLGCALILAAIFISQIRVSYSAKKTG
jgi:drug/metabolite transporter (DMT)-like permease